MFRIVEFDHDSHLRFVFVQGRQQSFHIVLIELLCISNRGFGVVVMLPEIFNASSMSASTRRNANSPLCATRVAESQNSNKAASCGLRSTAGAVHLQLGIILCVFQATCFNKKSSQSALHNQTQWSFIQKSFYTNLGSIGLMKSF